LDQIWELIDVMFAVGGPVLIVYGIASFIHTRYFVRQCAETSGEVIRLERSQYPDEYGYSYAPVFSFTAADGRSFTVTSKVSSSPPGFAEGEQVRVRYDPSNPNDARIHTFFQTWGTAVIPLLVGLGFLAFGLYHFGHHLQMH
jgi:hypothetical protein